MRDYSTCKNGEKCTNPRQGRLVETDYHKAGINGRRRICAVCRKKGIRVKIERNYSVCSMKSNCVNPRQYKLKKDDFSPNYRKKTDGSISYRTVCKACKALDTRRYRKEATAFGCMTEKEILRSPLDVRLAQLFCLGKLPNEILQSK